MVTHNKENLQWFDRTVYLRDGRLEKDSLDNDGELPKAM
jgi:ABC-type lipoprotein export system ATPase subunit